MDCLLTSRFFWYARFEESVQHVSALATPSSSEELDHVEFEEGQIVHGPTPTVDRQG